MKKTKIKTVFDLPVKESKDKLAQIIQDVYDIVDCDEFVEFSKKIEISKDATPEEIRNFVGKEMPKRIRQLLDLIFIDKFDNIIRICATIFCKSPEEYANKSINDIINDFDSVSGDTFAKFLGFFTRAGA